MSYKIDYCLVLGLETWPPGCSINFCLGHKFGGIDYLSLPALEPLEVTEVRVSMVSPPESGIFSGQWRMKTAAGNICGGLWLFLSRICFIIQNALVFINSLLNVISYTQHGYIYISTEDPICSLLHWLSYSIELLY